MKFRISFADIFKNKCT